MEAEERPDDFLLDRLEAFSGLSFREYKRLAFEEFVEDFEWRLQPENAGREAENDMQVTGRSFEEVKQSWADVHYKKEIQRLG